MKIVSWENLFEHHILVRGLEYYSYELVKVEAMNAQTIEAVVEGTDTYSVQITLQENCVKQMYCSCPYAAEGNNCKHMAAVLFAAADTESPVRYSEELIMQLEQKETAERDRTLKQEIAALPEDKLRSLLLDAAKKHSDVCDRITLIGKKAVDPTIRKRWAADLREISLRSSDHRGFINYYCASDYSNELLQYMDDTISPLIENRLIMDAFELVGLVFTEAMTQNIDDSDGELMYIANTCMEYWADLIPAPESDQAKMLQWFESEIKLLHEEIGEDWLWQTVFEDFTDKALLPKILDMLDKRIDSAGKYELQELIGQRIDLMKRMDMPKEIISAYKKNLWSMPFIRVQELDRLESERKWEDALALLNECEEIDRDNVRLMKEHSARRVRILKRSGQKSAYAAALRSYVFGYPQFDMTYVTELKQAVSPEEWSELLDTLFQNENTRSLRSELQLSEGMLEQLMSEIEASRNYYGLERYEKVLRKIYPERVRDLLIKHLDEQMRIASKRSAYSSVARSLKHLFGYPQGRKKAAELASAWRKDFSRRTAMLEELEKVKL